MELSVTARRRLAEEGFTLLEVLVALLVGMIGLIGTVAVQQAVMNATANANDAQVAMRLASKTLEEFNTRRTQAHPHVDMLAGIANGAWSAPVYLDAQGKAGVQSAKNRWTVQTRVTNTGIGLPYNISVQVTYARDTGAPKVVQLDIERRKTW
jgi:Tfp pilus assembly protein PilV